MTKECDQGFHRRLRQIGVLSRIYDSLVCKRYTIYSNAIPLPGRGRSASAASRVGVNVSRRSSEKDEANQQISPHPGALRAPTLPFQGRAGASGTSHAI